MWDLAFITQSGPCDPTYDFPVDIINGVITQPNLVRFRGNASGRGTWSGHAGNARCKGYWTAQRE